VADRVITSIVTGITRRWFSIQKNPQPLTGAGFLSGGENLPLFQNRMDLLFVFHLFEIGIHHIVICT
jgi:hypothetical protein